VTGTTGDNVTVQSGDTTTDTLNLSNDTVTLSANALATVDGSTDNLALASKDTFSLGGNGGDTVNRREHLSRQS